MAEKLSPNDPVTIFQVENNIHVLASTLDTFFNKVYQQPPSTWAKSITGALLFPFLTRPVLSHACFYGERNQVGHAILNSPMEEIRQNWLDWFVPLLTYQADFVAPDEVETSPNALTSGEQGPETIWATNMLLLCTCLHWSFMNRPPEDFTAALQEIQPRCEVMSGGWNEIAASRVRGLYKGLLHKVLKSTSARDQDLRILDNIGVLAAAVEDFIFFSPLCKQGPKAEGSTVGVHVDANGVVCRELIKLVHDIVHHQLKDTSGGTILKMVDKKEKNEAKKRRELLEEIGNIFTCYLTWSTCLSGTVENYAQLKTMPGLKLEIKQEFSSFGLPDGSHLRLNDRVMVHARDSKMLGTLMYKGAIGSRVVLGIAFEDFVGCSDDNECAKYFKCLPGYGGFAKPENVQLANELVINTNYDKATVQLVDMMSKRPRFKNSNKKQALVTLEEAVYFAARLRSATRPKTDIPASTLITSWDEVPFETVIEQAKAGAYSLRRAIRFLDKTLTVKSTFATSLIKICQEEDTKTLNDEMGSIAHDIQTSSEYCLAVRLRNFVNSVNLEVKTPLETLEKEYEVSVNEMKNICGRAEKEIEAAREKLIAQMKEAWKVYEEVIRLKGEMQDVGSPKAIAAAGKLSPIVQKCGVMFVQYERACTEWVQKGQPAFRAFQKQGLAAFQVKEHRRLVATRTYLERYLAICTEFNEPYFQIKQHSELISNMAPQDDLACYAVQFRKPATRETGLPQLPCSGAEVLTGTNERELLASSSSEPQRAPPPATNPSRNKYGTLGNTSFSSPPLTSTSAAYATMPPPVALPSPPSRAPPRNSGSAVGMAGFISPGGSRRPPPRQPPRSESSDDVPLPDPLEDVEPSSEIIENLPEETTPIIQPIPSPRAPPKYGTLDRGGSISTPTPFRLPSAVTNPIIRRLPPRELSLSREQSLPQENESPTDASVSRKAATTIADERPPPLPKLPSSPMGPVPPQRGPPPASRYGTMTPVLSPVPVPTATPPVISIIKYKPAESQTPSTPTAQSRPAAADRSKSPVPTAVERARSPSPSPHASQSTTAQTNTSAPCNCGCATFVPQSFRKNMCVMCSHVH